MKKSIFAGLATIVLALLTVTPATAESYDIDDECVPADAWTETIEHPAVTEIVHHDATYATEYQYIKQVRGNVQKWFIVWYNDGTFDWENWSGGSTQWSEQNVDVLETGPHSAVQASGTGWRKVTTEYRYVPTGETRQGRELTAAYDETVVVTPAWTETIEHPAIVCEEPEPEPTDPPEDPEPGDDQEPADPEPTQPPAQPAPPAAPPAAPEPASPTFTG